MHNNKSLDSDTYTIIYFLTNNDVRESIMQTISTLELLSISYKVYVIMLFLVCLLLLLLMLLFVTMTCDGVTMTTNNNNKFCSTHNSDDVTDTCQLRPPSSCI